MQAETITEDSLRALVYAFYGKVRGDADLAPIFTAQIKDDEWDVHLEQMVDFWSSIMLTSGKYHGNPMQKHKALPAFDIALFARWLALFSETARELFLPQVAERLEEKSQRIAQSLKLGLYPPKLTVRA